jgi:hypothetical protein
VRAYLKGAPGETSGHPPLQNILCEAFFVKPLYPEENPHVLFIYFI